MAESRIVDQWGIPYKAGKLADNEMERHDIHVDEDTGVMTRVTTYDAAIPMEQAHYERMTGRNGFTKGRGGRCIGEMPIAEYMEMERIARESGDYVTGKDLRKYLQNNREYMTVARINTGASGKIIIK